LTTNQQVASVENVGRKLLAGMLVAAIPLMSSCVSAIDDTTAFGFSPTSTTELADAASSGSGDADVAASADAEASAAQIADAAASATQVAAAEPSAEPEPVDQRLTEARPVAAYAGGTVSEGDQASSNSAGQPQKSLFASLFARSEARTPIKNAERSKSRRVILKREAASEGGSDLPGVDPSSLFEIGQRASADDEDAIDDVVSSYKVASLGGFARLAPNGLKVAREEVQTSCFPAKLVQHIRAIEQRFGTKVVITSGYRSPTHNRRVNGAKRSQHMSCKAADLIIPGADRFKVAAFARSLPGRGGVGTYCHTQAIHVDVGPKRDWNWRCRRRGK